MFVRKSFQFRLRPTKKQARALDEQLNECRWLYNELLAQRKLAYEELEISLTKYQQSMFLPELKKERPGLNLVHSQVLQNVVDRKAKNLLLRPKENWPNWKKGQKSAAIKGESYQKSMKEFGTAEKISATNSRKKS